MKKLLITGASGFLGWHLCQVAQAAGWQVYGSYQTRRVELAGVTGFPLDLTDLASVKLVMQELRPDALLHLAALSSPNACQSDPELSYQVNVVASCELAGRCAEAQIPCLFTSSEQVFDGLNPPYREADPVCPINRYGEHKVAAEVGMRQRCEELIVCRMPLLFGAAPADSFIQPWIRALRAGTAIDLFTDEIRNPITGFDAAQGILLALDQAPSILHLGGAERLSRYEIGQTLADVLQISAAKLNPRLQADVKMAAPRPPDVSLDNSLAVSLGFRPSSLRSALTALLPQL
jgi:dTDP-4-dehydrorhamnose reductase